MHNQKTSSNDPKVQRRLDAIQYAEEHTVVDACRRYNIDRTSFYKYKNRYEKEGIEGLKDKSRKNNGHPNKIKKEIEDEIVEYLTQHPKLSIRKATDYFIKKGVKIHYSTVWRIKKNKPVSTEIEILMIRLLEKKIKTIQDNDTIIDKDVIECLAQKEALSIFPGFKYPIGKRFINIEMIIDALIEKYLPKA